MLSERPADLRDVRPQHHGCDLPLHDGQGQGEDPWPQLAAQDVWVLRLGECLEDGRQEEWSDADPVQHMFSTMHSTVTPSMISMFHMISNQ